MATFRHTVSPVFFAVLFAGWLAATGSAQVQFVNTTYRVLVNETADPAWINGEDIFDVQGYDMSHVPVGRLNDPAVDLPSPLGHLRLSSRGDRLFYSMDFYKAYHLPTFWPYCESLTKCLVFSQQQELRTPGSPATVFLPPEGTVHALDFYLDLAIDCEGVVGITVVCEAVAYPGPLVAKVTLASVCGSPNVGAYLGFYNPEGSVDKVLVTCPTAYARAIGLLRVGRKRISSGSSAQVRPASRDPQVQRVAVSSGSAAMKWGHAGDAVQR